MRTKLLSAFAVALAVAVPSAALAAPTHLPLPLVTLPKATRMDLGAPTAPPLGFVFYCARDRAACAPRKPSGTQTDGQGRVTLTPAVVEAIVRTNRDVNTEIRPKAERPGAPDTWLANVREGDCEDFALTKQVRLLAEGFPSSAAVIAKVRMRNGLYHAVLVVRTSAGDVVLDNLTQEIRAWNRTPYTYVGVQSPLDPRIWRST